MNIFALIYFLEVEVISKNKKTITLKDVAARAEVSLATASRVMSKRGYASEINRRKVIRAARELGYKPNKIARSLKLKSTNTIGLMITDIINPFYSYLTDGVLDCAKKYGYHIIVCITDEDPKQEREYLKVLMEERAAGIIAVPTGYNQKYWHETLKLGMKLVFVDREIPNISNADVILVDNVKGAYNAIKYLIKLGHKRIGIINGPTITTTGAGRLKGYYQALKEAHLPVDKDLIEIVTFKKDSGIAAAKRLLSSTNPPTAIFAANNALGEAVVSVIRNLNLEIQKDISLIIFDDVPWTSLSYPRITVVSQPTHSLGYLGLEILDRQLKASNEKEKRVNQKTILLPKLIIRESCAQLKN